MDKFTAETNVLANNRQLKIKNLTKKAFKIIPNTDLAYHSPLQGLGKRLKH